MNRPTPSASILFGFGLGFGAFAALGGCADAPAEETPSLTNLSIAVAPLELEDIIRACYSVTAYNGPGASGADPAHEVIWTRELCSDQFGNGPGGSLAYVGPCDADAGINSVELALNRLDGAPLGSWINPCPDERPCYIDTPCIENSDVPVTFNLTIMRQGGAGFLDVVVNFEGLFCSAKFDTCYAPDKPGGDEEPILLLVAADGQRRHTGVLAVTCTEGFVARGPAHLYIDPVVIDCGEAYSVELDPAAGPGLVYEPPLSHESGEVWQYLINRGLESNECANVDGLAQPCPGIYWIMSMGIEGLPPGCSLSARFTVSAGPLQEGTTPSNTAYPILVLNTEITDEDGIICQQNPLNGEGSKLQVEYTDIQGEYYQLDTEVAPDGEGGVTVTKIPPDPTEPAEP